MAAGASGGSGFFGQISMLREFWAEDPDWTNPGDGNDITSWRDNGSYADDVTAYIVAPKFDTTGVNGLPALNFTGNVRAAVSNSATATTAPFSLVLAINVAATTFGVMSDDRASQNIFTTSGSSWQMFNGGVTASGGTPTTGDHVIVCRFKANDMEMFVDGASVATSGTGGGTTTTGIVFGADRSATNGFNGHIAYAAVYSGDITVDGDYSTWIAELESYYGI